MSGRVGKGAFQALSMKRGSDEGHGHLRYRLMFQSRARMRWRMKGSRVGWHLHGRGRRLDRSL